MDTLTPDHVILARGRSLMWSMRGWPVRREHWLKLARAGHRVNGMVPDNVIAKVARLDRVYETAQRAVAYGEAQLGIAESVRGGRCAPPTAKAVPMAVAKKRKRRTRAEMMEQVYRPRLADAFRAFAVQAEQAGAEGTICSEDAAALAAFERARADALEQRAAAPTLECLPSGASLEQVRAAIHAHLFRSPFLVRPQAPPAIPEITVYTAAEARDLQLAVG